MLASVVVAAIFAARGAPAQFRAADTGHSISADSHHDQRPRFDNSSSGWSTPVESFLVFPPSAGPAQLIPAPALFSTLQTEGFHFNRPPPLT
ncbi:MAG: hypothetical protein WCA99_06510 [Candidatus Sulfotelmatobacter sp.]